MTHPISFFRSVVEFDTVDLIYTHNKIFTPASLDTKDCERSIFLRLYDIWHSPVGITFLQGYYIAIGANRNPLVSCKTDHHWLYCNSIVCLIFDKERIYNRAATYFLSFSWISWGFFPPTVLPLTYPSSWKRDASLNTFFSAKMFGPLYTVVKSTVDVGFNSWVNWTNPNGCSLVKVDVCLHRRDIIN